MIIKHRIEFLADFQEKTAEKRLEYNIISLKNNKIHIVAIT